MAAKNILVVPTDFSERSLTALAWVFPVYWMINSAFLPTNWLRPPEPSFLPFVGALPHFRRPAKHPARNAPFGILGEAGGEGVVVLAEGGVAITRMEVADARLGFGEGGHRLDLVISLSSASAPAPPPESCGRCAPDSR